MFVPCDKDGNVLEEPKQKEHWTSEGFGAYSMSIKDIENYNKAKERVLFEGLSKMKLTSLSGEKVIKYGKDINFNHESIFEIRNNEVKIFYENIESVIHFDLTLTQTAIKQIGL